MPRQPKEKNFLEILKDMPDVGDDADFERVQDAKEPPEVFESGSPDTKNESRPLRERINQVLGKNLHPRTGSPESDKTIWQQHLLDKHQPKTGFGTRIHQTVMNISGTVDTDVELPPRSLPRAAPDVSIQSRYDEMRKYFPLGEIETADQKPEYTTKTLSLEDMDAAIESFQSAELSLGQLSKTLNKNQRETIKLLTSLDIPVIDYDLAEDLEAIEHILKDKS